MFKAITNNSFFGINSGNCCDMLVTYSEKIQVWARGWWDKCMLMMETDLVNSMWHLCSPWITGLGSEALQWETQLQFFNEHLTTLSFYDSFSGSTACCVFSFGNLTWSLSGPFPIKQGSLSSFVSLWKGLVRLEWIHQCEAAARMCESLSCVSCNSQQSSGMSWPRGVWDLQHWKYLDQVGLLGFLLALV